MNTPNSTLATSRCQHRTPSGRQCSSPATQSSAFCARHAIAPPSDSIDFSADLIREGDHFQEAQQINNSLVALYKLIAAGRISPRRASVLAYVAHLILNSLKAIDYDLRWYRKRLTGLPITRPVSPALGPVGPGTKPLPATAEEFVTEALTRSRKTPS